MLDVPAALLEVEAEEVPDKPRVEELLEDKPVVDEVVVELPCVDPDDAGVVLSPAAALLDVEDFCVLGEIEEVAVLLCPITIMLDDGKLALLEESGLVNADILTTEEAPVSGLSPEYELLK